MRTIHLLATTAALGLAGTFVVAGPAATAHPAPKPTVTTVQKGLVGPLKVAVATDGTRYVTDNFTGTLYRQAPGAAATPIYQAAKHTEVGAVSVTTTLTATTVTFAVNAGGNNKHGQLWTITNGGPPTLLADIAKFEKSANPDAKNHYGFKNLPKACAAQLPRQVGPATYTGVKETHPFATTTVGGVTYLADAGANDVVAVTPAGVVSTVAVLKPVKVRISAAGAKANHLPACTVGRTYGFEPVPTDIESGPDGMLYLTSLPGGPEDPSLGANGRVLRLDPATGKVSTVVGGLAGATGLAVAANGDIYVTQLFGGVIDRVAAGTSKAKTYVKVPLPADVEIAPTGLVATVNAVPGKKPKGAVVTITPDVQDRPARVGGGRRSGRRAAAPVRGCPA